VLCAACGFSCCCRSVHPGAAVPVGLLRSLPRRILLPPQRRPLRHLHARTGILQLLMQSDTHGTSEPWDAGSAIRVSGAHESFGAALAHMRSFFYLSCALACFSLSLLWCPVVFLHVMSCMQLFFASFRLLMLQVGTADEMAPPESRSQFAVFAIGAVAAPLIHVRLTGAQVRVWAGCVRAQVNQRRSLCLTVCRASACVLAVCAQATSVYFSWRLHQQLRVTRQCSHSQKQPSSSSRTHWPRCCALRSLWDGSRSA